MVSFKFNQYWIKLYDKGVQNGLPADLLRVELKVNKMQFLSEKGVNITTLADLHSGKWNPHLLELLLKQWDRILICPAGLINPESIGKHQQLNQYLQGVNPNYWTGLTARQYNKQAPKFRRVVSEFATLDVHTLIRDTIAAKWETLTAPKKKGGKSYLLVYGNFYPSPRPEGGYPPGWCSSCGRNIAHRPGTKFCSAKDVGEQSAHRCRNRDSNPRNSRKRWEQRLHPGPTLFPVWLHYGIL